MFPIETPARNPRRRPDLNIDTSAQATPNGHGRDTIPQTPPSRRPPVSGRLKPSASSRALRAPSHTTQRDGPDIESYLDSIPPVDVSNKENERPNHPPGGPRDSHDLSLSPRQVTRDSLVANMLLSLDQMDHLQFAAPRPGYDEPSGYAPYGDDFSRSMNMTTRQARNDGGHGYSYSSDLEAGDDSSRMSSQQSRGRRSNSSSGFQSSLGRINSMRESPRQRNMGDNPRQLHSRGGRGSKSSSTNSIDAGYAQVLGSQRWAHGFGQSSGFDCGPPRPSTNPQASPWHLEFSGSFLNDEYDAAPTPTVPGGPRKLNTVPSLPVLTLQREAPLSPALGGALERKRSTRSSRSATVGRKPEPKKADSREMPPLPMAGLRPAPAPPVAYEKAKELLAIAQPNTPPQPTRERPGFFRRMFGSSKNSSSSTPPHSASSPHLTTATATATSTSTAAIDTPAGSPANRPQHQTDTLKAPSAPPSRDSPHHPTSHGLQKKTSSFFRRRKHSITEAVPPVPPALLIVPPAPSIAPPAPSIAPPANLALPVDLSSKAEPGTATSLRHAMDPFLKGSPASHCNPPADGTPTPSRAPSSAKGQRQADRDCSVRGFSPDYEPGPKAVIRSVDPEPAAAPGSRPAADVPAAARDDSFFHDNSDSEPSPQRRRTRQPRPASSGRELLPVSKMSRRASSQSLRDTSGPGHQRDLKAARDPKAAGARPETSGDDAGARRESIIALPIEGVMADGTRAGLLSIQTDALGGAAEPPGDVKTSKSIDEPHFVVGDPTEDDCQKAQGIYAGSEDFIQKEKAAAWMGEEGPVRQRTLRAYMDLYDFGSRSIVESLRLVCGRLVLRAETQQVDRILVAFARRWCGCNPNHGFKTTDVIHTICYSIMLLNTDLHMADIEHKMTRSQFVKNTMTTIRQALEDSAPEVFERPSILPGKGQSLTVDGGSRTSTERDRRASFRASFKPPPRPESALGDASSHGTAPLVNAPFDGPIRGWEAQVELVLKDIYVSIRDERLPLFGSEPSQPPTPGGLSVISMLKRTPSVLSKAPSEGVSSTRGRVPESARATASRFSKSRSRHRALGGNGFSSSRTSFDDGNSLWTQTESSATWSRASLGRTHTSPSVDSFASSHAHGEYQQSIGFANALSQAIIREDNAATSSSAATAAAAAADDDDKPAQLLEDESLELSGPPWVKEGIVTHKHHLDGADRKAKDRNWTEVFAVIQKGQMALFSFTPNKSLRKSRSRLHGGALPKGTVVGGGNWQENATNLGTFFLRQALASALPAPGYSRQRPNVWALSLPTGAVHLFQVGTPEISKEFVNTANYWSARLSTHPLVGGISNIEYGWGDAVVNNPLVAAAGESPAGAGTRPETGRSSAKGHSRPGSATNAASVGMAIRTSLQSHRSIRSGSFDFGRPRSGSSGALGGMGSTGGGGGGGPGAAAAGAARHAKLPGDRVHIAQWTPPAQSMRPSHLAEREQLEMLAAYVRGIEAELQAHNGLRSPMLLAFAPRGANHTRAMANWQRKSEHLLREIVKFRTYVDALQAAEARKAEVYRERETARRAAMGEEVESLGGDDDDDDDEEEDGAGARGDGAGETAEGDETLRPA